MVKPPNSQHQYGNTWYFTTMLIKVLATPVTPIIPGTPSTAAGDLELSQKRVTKAYDLTDIDNLKTFNFSYPSHGYAVYYDSDGDPYYVPRTIAVSGDYTYIVRHEGSINTQLVGWIQDFMAKYNGTDKTYCSLAQWDGGGDTVTP